MTSKSKNQPINTITVEMPKIATIDVMVLGSSPLIYNRLHDWAGLVLPSPKKR